jgi:hypothetical protein
VLAGDYPEYSVLRHKPTPPSRAELDLKAGGLPFGAAVWTDGRSSGRPMLEVYLGPSTASRSLTPAANTGSLTFSKQNASVPQCSSMSLERSDHSGGISADLADIHCGGQGGDGRGARRRRGPGLPGQARDAARERIAATGLVVKSPCAGCPGHDPGGTDPARTAWSRPVPGQAVEAGAVVFPGAELRYAANRAELMLSGWGTRSAPALGAKPIMIAVGVNADGQREVLGEARRRLRDDAICDTGRSGSVPLPHASVVRGGGHAVAPAGHRCRQPPRRDLRHDCRLRDDRGHRCRGQVPGPHPDCHRCHPPVDAALTTSDAR